MTLETLACPNCTAPLPLSPEQALTVCLYCSATIRVPSPAAPAAIENTLAPTDMAQIKQLVLHGRQAEASQHYQQQTGASAADATAVIQSLGRELSLGIIFQQRLRPLGILFVSLCTLVLVASLAAALAGIWSRWLALPLAGFAGLNLLLFRRGIGNSIKYRRASTAPATVLKITTIGLVKKQGQTIYAMRALLSVQPEHQDPFQAEITFPVREKNLLRAQPGLVIQVKYLVDDPQSVIYYKA